MTVLKRLIQPREFSQGEIDRERTVMAEELALRRGENELDGIIWREFYGDEGYTLLDLEAEVSADELSQLWDEVLAPSNVVLVVAGLVETEIAGNIAESFLRSLKGEPQAQRESRSPAIVSGKVDGPISGTAFAVASSQIGNRELVNSLAASMFVSVSLGGQTVYSPTSHHGVVVTRIPAGKSVADISEGQIYEGFPLGRAFATRWANDLRRNPQSLARFYSRVLLTRKGFDLETVYNQAITLESAHFVEAVKAIKAGLEVTGS